MMVKTLKLFWRIGYQGPIMLFQEKIFKTCVCGSDHGFLAVTVMAKLEWTPSHFTIQYIINQSFLSLLPIEIDKHKLIN